MRQEDAFRPRLSPPRRPALDSARPQASRQLRRPGTGPAERAGAGRIGVGALTAVLDPGDQNLSFQRLDFFIQYGTLREALNVISAPHEVVSAPGAPPLRVTRVAIEFRDALSPTRTARGSSTDSNCASNPSKRSAWSVPRVPARAPAAPAAPAFRPAARRRADRRPGYPHG